MKLACGILIINKSIVCRSKQHELESVGQCQMIFAQCGTYVYKRIVSNKCQCYAKDVYVVKCVPRTE